MMFVNSAAHARGVWGGGYNPPKETLSDQIWKWFDWSFTHVAIPSMILILVVLVVGTFWAVYQEYHESHGRSSRRKTR